MPSVSDPFHPLYLDEAAMRAEVDRAAAVCGGCRACVDRCDVFPRLFELLDRAGADPGRSPVMSPAEQDHAVGACFDCGLCAVGCPAGPGLTDDPIEIPVLMARARQVRVRTGSDGAARRLVSGIRRLPAAIIAPLTTRTRFSTWFRARPEPTEPLGAGAVALFPTCHVEHHDPDLGRDLVGLLERVGVGCSLPEGLQCCGAPQLDAGDIDGLVVLGRRNVRRLAEAVRSGREVVVPQPRCLSVIRTAYPAHVGGADAELVAAHTHDPSAMLLERHGADAALLLRVPDAGPVVVHAPCRTRALEPDLPSVALLELAGFDVTVVAGCASPDPRVPAGTLDRTVQGLDAAARDAGSGGVPIIVGDCGSAAQSLGQTGLGEVTHPIRLLTRALGLTAR